MPYQSIAMRTIDCKNMYAAVKTAPCRSNKSTAIIRSPSSNLFRPSSNSHQKARHRCQAFTPDNAVGTI